MRENRDRVTGIRFVPVERDPFVLKTDVFTAHARGLAGYWRLGDSSGTQACDQLGLNPGTLAWMALLLLAGGHVGIGAALLWSLGLGCAVAAAMLALAGAQAPGGDEPADRDRITIRGPLSYAGPGSLGGTKSALRR